MRGSRIKTANIKAEHMGQQTIHMCIKNYIKIIELSRTPSLCTRASEQNSRKQVL